MIQTIRLTSRNTGLALVFLLGICASALAVPTVNRYGATQQQYQQSGPSQSHTTPYGVDQSFSYQDGFTGGGPSSETPSAVPEPATVILMGMGMAATACRARKQRKV